MLSRAIVAGAIGLAFVIAFNNGCSSEQPDEVLGTTREPLMLDKVDPLTKVNVKTAGEIDVEADYLPQVVCCENGAAPPEALRAQAVMARTYMVFRYYGEGVGTTAKPLSGTTADQAYFCQQKTTTACRDAVTSTKGQITAYTNAKGDRFANVSFFVDGPRPACLKDKSCKCAKPSATTSMSPADHPSDCDDCFTFSSQGAANPAYVTYNWANAGDKVIGSTIGDPKNESNRGCASQNIEACLAYAGWSYSDMLRVFYGQDLELRMMDGTEVTAPPPPTSSSSSSGSSSSDEDSGGGCTVSRSTRDPALIVFAVALLLRRRKRRI